MEVCKVTHQCNMMLKYNIIKQGAIAMQRPVNNNHDTVCSAVFYTVCAEAI
jgi:hypothetical protein